MQADGDGHGEFGEAPPWLEPYPDVLLDGVADQVPGARARYDSTQAVSLAFITALQLLPPLERAVLVLHDVQGYHAVEVAGMLDTTPDAVGRALAQARPVVDQHLAEAGGSHADPDAEHRLAACFTHAVEHTDLDALTSLLADDIKLSIIPAMLEYHGVPTARRIFASATFRPGRVYRVIATRANNQPAFALYLADPHSEVFRPYALLVLTTAGGHITAITAFHTTTINRFGLPRTLPETR